MYLRRLKLTDQQINVVLRVDTLLCDRLPMSIDSHSARPYEFGGDRKNQTIISIRVNDFARHFIARFSWVGSGRMSHFSVKSFLVPVFVSGALCFSGPVVAQTENDPPEHHEMDIVNALMIETNKAIKVFVDAEAKRDILAACDAYGPAIDSMRNVADTSLRLANQITDDDVYADIMRYSADEAEASVADLTARKAKNCTPESIARIQAIARTENWWDVMGMPAETDEKTLIELASFSLPAESANWREAKNLWEGKKSKRKEACGPYLRAYRNILKSQWYVGTFLKLRPNTEQLATIQPIYERMADRIKILETETRQGCDFSGDLVFFDYMMIGDKTVKKSEIKKAPEALRAAYSEARSQEYQAFIGLDLEGQGLLSLSCEKYTLAADSLTEGARKMVWAEGVDLMGFAAMRFDVARRGEDARKAADKVCNRDESGERMARVIAIMNEVRRDMQPEIDSAINWLASDHPDWACEKLVALQGSVNRAQNAVAEMSNSDTSHPRFREAYEAATATTELVENAQTLMGVACK